MRKHAAVVAEIVAELLQCERFTLQDFKNRWQYSEPLFGALLTHAYDILRVQYGIEFRPGPHGMRFRCNHQEAANRGMRRTRKGHKALARGVDCLRVAEKLAASPEVKEAYAKTADHRATQLVIARSRARKRLAPGNAGE